MAALTNAEMVAILQAYGFYPGSNYSLVKESGGTDFIKIPNLDEFIRAVPFERYKGDADVDATTAVPAGDSSDDDEKRAHLPTNATTGETGVTWYATTPPTSPSAPDSNLAVETANGTSFAFNRVLSRILLSPDATATMKASRDLSEVFTRMASLMTLRDLGRQLINGDGTSDTPSGLATIYDGTYALETQVIDGSAVSIEAGVEVLMRRVSAGGSHGFGEGPNALIMSRRAFGELVSSLSSSSGKMDYLPDALSPGRLRPYYNGVAVYIAPVRDDEDSPSSPPTFPSANGNNPVTTSVYAAVIGGTSGIRVLYADGDDENHGLTTEEGKYFDGADYLQYFQARGRYALFIPERTAVARLHGVNLTVNP